MWYPVRTPAVFRWIYNRCIWQKSQTEKIVYLSFDDGPHPEITPFVLEELKKWNAKASFFCIGENVVRYPEIFEQIQQNGHTIGNHTFHHMNGWETNNETYFHDIQQAAEYIPAVLFRPPYGRIRFSQLKKLEKHTTLKVVMWSLLSGDFDQSITPEKCVANILDNIRNGDIVVFHDSLKAKKNLTYALPIVLAYLKQQGYQCKQL